MVGSRRASQELYFSADGASVVHVQVGLVSIILPAFFIAAGVTATALAQLVRRPEPVPLPAT